MPDEYFEGSFACLSSRKTCLCIAQEEEDESEEPVDEYLCAKMHLV